MSGDFDPFAMLFVMEEAGWDTVEIRRQLINESGLLGISGVSGDVRDIEAAAKAGERRRTLGVGTPIFMASKSILARISPRSAGLM